PGLRDLIILTVNTAKVAVAKEDIPGTFCSRQARLFAEMRGTAGNNRQTAGIAGRDLVVQTVVAA
ncbi:MAG: hypothetical protein ACJ72Z_07525, partial [Pyrinomonadaceae bacterium]